MIVREILVMNRLKAAFFVLVLGVIATPALANPTATTLYEYKHWHVQAVQYDDGTISCLAEVSDYSNSFTVWVNQDQSLRLQFYSTAWDFGEGDTADLRVKIDRRSPWTLTDAELYKNSILFDLPNSDASVNFLVEIAQGTRAYLQTSSGEPVIDYSLAGSKASMNALIECGNALR
jgi:hypothetical protein